jgi:hypothetical protein
LIQAEYQHKIDGFSILKYSIHDGRYLGRLDYTQALMKWNSDLSRDIDTGPDKVFTTIGYQDSLTNKYRGRLTAFDRSGRVAWQRFHPDATWSNYNGIDAEATPDSGAVLAYFTLRSNRWYAFVEKLDKNGNSTWRTQYPNSHRGGNLIDLAVLPKGQGYVCLWNIETERLSWDYAVQPGLVFKLDAAGQLEWVKSDSLRSYDLYDVLTTPSGNIVICGTDQQGRFPDTVRPRDYVAYLMCLSPAGKLLWERTVDDFRKGAEGTEFFAGKALPNGDMVFTGLRLDTLYAISAPYVFDAWVVKTDSMGCLYPGCGPEEGVLSVGQAKRAARRPFTVFPVPTDGVFTLVSVLGVPLSAGRYEALLHDPQGRLLERRAFDPDLPESFDAGSHPPGVYLLTVLRDGAVVQVLKVAVGQ